MLSYLKEFLRVGYYVSNEYDDPEMQENPPDKPDFERLRRNILASNPRYKNLLKWIMVEILDDTVIDMSIYIINQMDKYKE